MAKICCSIELEPRTLREGQLSQAREVAVDIIQKKEPKEASSMLVQALKPVSPIKEMETLNIDDDEDKVNYITGKTCQCSCTSPKVDSPDQSQSKEPLSAPF